METVERHFLSRSYESKKKIEELLENRYSQTGGQKPYLIFGERAEPEEPPAEIRAKDKILTRKRKHHTRVQLKEYISNTIANQKKLSRKIKQYRRQHTKSSSTQNSIETSTKSSNQSFKPFPIEKMLDHYGIPTFEEFLPMNNLWQNYMQELLFPNGQIHGPLMVLPRLSSADYSGCLLTVTHSKNTNLVGLRGIVVCDMQYLFVICCPRGQDLREWNENADSADMSPLELVGGLRVVAKKGSLFSFDVLLPGNDDECMTYTIVGLRMEFRAVDRSGRKFKNHNVDDL